MLIKTKFRKEVEKRLVDLDMKMQDLAKRMNISKAYLCDLLNGARNSPERKRQIEDILGLERETA